MSVKSLLAITPRQKWILIILLVCTLVIMSIQWTVERQAQRLVDEHTVSGKTEVDFTLLINQLSVAFPDSAVIRLSDSTQVELKRGRLDLCGFHLWKYLVSGEPGFRIIELSARSLKMNHSTTREGSELIAELYLRAMRISLDTMDINLDKRVIRGSDFRIELEELFRGDSTWGFDLVKLDGRNLSYEDPGVLECEFDEVYQGSIDGPLILRGMDVGESSEPENNRVMVSGHLDSLVVYDILGLGRETEWSAGSAMARGLHLEIDQISERPFCNGRKPCVQRLMTDILIQAPIRDSIQLGGSLIFRHFKDKEIASQLTLDSYHCDIRYDSTWHFRNPESASCRVVIDAEANGGIPLRFSGDFYGSRDYSYSLCTQPFQMPLLNPAIPSQDGYQVEIVSGKCDKFCMDVKGKDRESVAHYQIRYKALSLDIKGDKNFKTRMIETAIPLVVNRDYDSEKPLEHKGHLPEERVFLYELGDHVNEGFKMAVLKHWLQKRDR